MVTGTTPVKQLTSVSEIYLCILSLLNMKNTADDFQQKTTSFIHLINCLYLPTFLIIVCSPIRIL